MARECGDGDGKEEDTFDEPLVMLLAGAGQKYFNNKLNVIGFSVC